MHARSAPLPVRQTEAPRIFGREEGSQGPVVSGTGQTVAGSVHAKAGPPPPEGLPGRPPARSLATVLRPGGVRLTHPQTTVPTTTVCRPAARFLAQARRSVNEPGEPGSRVPLGTVYLPQLVPVCLASIKPRA